MADPIWGLDVQSPLWKHIVNLRDSFRDAVRRVWPQGVDNPNEKFTDGEAIDEDTDITKAQNIPPLTVTASFSLGRTIAMRNDDVDPGQMAAMYEKIPGNLRRYLF